MTDETPPIAPDTDFRFFVAEDGTTRVSARFEAETVWLSQKALSELYQVTVPTVKEHIRGILQDHVCDSATIRNFRIVQQETYHE